MLLQIVLFILNPVWVLAGTGQEFTYREPVVIGEGFGSDDQSLGSSLENFSRFNYYENQSLRSFSSVFVEGVDQRFFGVNYNGFSLRDPSSTTGVFNMASLSAFRSNRLMLTGGAEIELATKNTNRTYVEVGVSSLKEFSLSGEHRECASKTCTSVEAVAQRAGGFSQLAGGVEDDFFEELSLSASKSFVLGGKKLTSRLLYYGQVLDLDSIAPLGGAVVESDTAEALNSVLFVGQDLEFSQKHRLMLSYTQSYRNQRDQGGADPSLNLSFRQRGEVLEAAYIYNQDFTFKAFNERFDLYSTSGLDSGFKMQKKSSLGDVVVDLSLGKTNLRSFDWSAEAGYKNFVLFYKGLPASLFQQSYNNEFSVGLDKLNAQEFLGVRQSGQNILPWAVKLKWNWSYSRIYRFIDFDLAQNAYENLGEVENFFIGLNFIKGPFWFLAQHQIARQVNGLKNDLPRRAPWTLGLRYEKKINKDFRVSTGAKWIAERKAFDQSDLKATWVSDLQLSYRAFSLTCTNVFSDNELVFKNLGRRPFSLRLSFQKNF